ncbi:MAG: hypothetical protein R2800_02360 [Flavipsychrobacter sp.]
MRKLISIPLLFIYMIAASGVIIQLHYCGQKLDSWNVFAMKADSCGDDGCDKMPESHGCCSDKVIKAKIAQDYQSTPSFYQDFSFLDIAIIPQHNCLYDFTYKQCEVKGLFYNANAPPGLWQNIPLYKLNTSFTFYG